MFFAAERQERSSTRRAREAADEGIILSPGMEISIGAPFKSRQPEKRHLNSVYPEFTSISTKELIKIADPTCEILEREERTAKKRKLALPLPALRGDVDVLPGPESVKPSPKAPKRYANLDEMVRDFPDIANIIAEQEARLERARVPLEYAVPYKKPLPEKPEPIFPALPSAVTEESGSKTMSTSSPPDLTSVAPTPAEPATATGGSGLLAGIEAELGEETKRKLKPKYKR